MFKIKLIIIEIKDFSSRRRKETRGKKKKKLSKFLKSRLSFRFSLIKHRAYKVVILSIRRSAFKYSNRECNIISRLLLLIPVGEKVVGKSGRYNGDCFSFFFNVIISNPLNTQVERLFSLSLSHDAVSTRRKAVC